MSCSPSVASRSVGEKVRPLEKPCSQKPPAVAGGGNVIEGDAEVGNSHGAVTLLPGWSDDDDDEVSTSRWCLTTADRVHSRLTTVNSGRDGRDRP